MRESLEWIHRFEYLNIEEFNLKMSKGGQKEKMAILATEGSLETAVDYGSISLEAGTYKFGELPNFLKISKIRGIIYRTEGLCV